MRVLFLYAEVMGYTVATIRSLVASGVELHVVYWDKNKLTPYVFPLLDGVFYYPRSEFSIQTLKDLADRIDPIITVVSGWTDRGYLPVARALRRKGRVVVAGLDAQWHGSARQRLAGVLGVCGLFSAFFSHAWVAGNRQFEFARRLGFRASHILLDLYSADTEIFQSAYTEVRESEHRVYPKVFLFVGRLEKVKGLETLIAAWEILRPRRGDWQLRLIGNGSMMDSLRNISGVDVTGFLQPESLVSEIKGVGCFILPSIKEPWGVVVHEFATAGLPMIVSDSVGASSSFLVPGLNGYRFRSQEASSLADAMAEIISKSDKELSIMGEMSNMLSRRISPKTSAANLLSAACMQKAKFGG
jgi:glycosyltransferase involved in cell wall biosynthesis